MYDIETYFGYTPMIEKLLAEILLRVTLSIQLKIVSLETIVQMTKRIQSSST